jgi:geranylgeranyl pyrophosphate synthase
VLSKAREYVNASIHSLQEVDASPVKEALMATADYALDRKW